MLLWHCLRFGSERWSSSFGWLVKGVIEEEPGAEPAFLELGLGASTDLLEALLAFLHAQQLGLSAFTGRWSVWPEDPPPPGNGGLLVYRSEGRQNVSGFLVVPSELEGQTVLAHRVVSQDNVVGSDLLGRGKSDPCLLRLFFGWFGRGDRVAVLLIVAVGGNLCEQVPRRGPRGIQIDLFPGQFLLFLLLLLLVGRGRFLPRKLHRRRGSGGNGGLVVNRNVRK